VAKKGSCWHKGFGKVDHSGTGIERIRGFRIPVSPVAPLGELFGPGGRIWKTPGPRMVPNNLDYFPRDGELTYPGAKGFGRDTRIRKPG